MVSSSPQPTAKSEQAFLDFVAMGPSRSLRSLAARYVQQKRYKTATTALSTLARWSSTCHWQDRLAAAATARSEVLLNEASELDADTFLVTSRLLNEGIHLATPGPTDGVVKVRESVRKQMPKGSTSVDVTVTLTIEQRRIVERIAASRGLDIDEVIDELHTILGAKA